MELLIDIGKVLGIIIALIVLLTMRAAYIYSKEEREEEYND